MARGLGNAIKCFFRYFTCLGLLVASTGCATAPYKFGKDIEMENTLPIEEGRTQIERGRPHKFLDASDWIWPESLISKLLLWNSKIDSHQVSEETVSDIARYLKENDLNNVKVRINQYAPGGEWRRLFRNRAVGGGWRYTLGIISVVSYTILPQRFFGGDNYNPFTNTISIYSDHPSVVIHEAAHSKDLALKQHKGSYAALSLIPFVSLYHEAKATNDALGYLRAQKPVKDQKEGYKILYPAYSTYIGGNLGSFVYEPYSYAIQVVAVIPAHIAGRIKAATLPEEAVVMAEERERP